MLVEKTFFLDPRVDIAKQVLLASDIIFNENVELRIHCPDENYLSQFRELLDERLRSLGHMP